MFVEDRFWLHRYPKTFPLCLTGKLLTFKHSLLLEVRGGKVLFPQTSAMLMRKLEAAAWCQQRVFPILQEASEETGLGATRQAAIKV